MANRHSTRARPARSRSAEKLPSKRSLRLAERILGLPDTARQAVLGVLDAYQNPPQPDPQKEAEKDRRKRLDAAVANARKKLVPCHNPLVQSDRLVDIACMAQLVLAYLRDVQPDDDGLHDDAGRGLAIIHEWIESALDWGKEVHLAEFLARRAVEHQDVAAAEKGGAK